MRRAPSSFIALVVVTITLPTIILLNSWPAYTAAPLFVHFSTGVLLGLFSFYCALKLWRIMQ